MSSGPDDESEAMDAQAAAETQATEPLPSCAPLSQPTEGQQEVAAAVAPNGHDLLIEVLAETRRLAEDFALKLKYDQAKDKTIDGLTEELRRHRAGLHFTLIRPFLADLLALHDDLLQLAEAGGGDVEGRATFGNLAATVEELLARQGVSSFALPHDRFESKQQRASRTVPTDEPALVGTVASHLRPGFMYEDRIVRPEHVAVYVPCPRAEASPVISTPE